ncbi:MAG: AbrB/MazE/SpoVT family DNA-binding domain-containing protein [Rhodoferax sp.]|nr:AbrB/MazE/SpoVT family DNA-binding domain-containing protein [Rhodoferax sp.]
MQALSKITSQGQVSVPAAVRQALGVGPGGMLEWVEENGRITVQRPARHSTKEIHDALFPQGSDSAPKTLGELKQGVRELMLRRHAGR